MMGDSADRYASGRRDSGALSTLVMIWTNTVDRHLLSVTMSSSPLLLLISDSIHLSSTSRNIWTIHSQSVGLINYLQTVQRNPNNQLAKKCVRERSACKGDNHFLFWLREPLPTMNFMGGLPVVPGVMGSLPGAGSCLPRGSPLVRDKSPSFFQNILRNIPGAHDYLASLLPSPKVDSQALYGKYHWFNRLLTLEILPHSVYKKNFERKARMEGRRSASIHYTDWSKCRPATPVSYIQNVLTELFG
ncbi:hypothetical protein COOONC_05899 [Cooperia oncophora]